MSPPAGASAAAPTTSAPTTSDRPLPSRRAAWTARPLAVLATIAIAAIVLSLVAMASNTEPLAERVESDQRVMEAIERDGNAFGQTERPDVTPLAQAEPREPVRLPGWLIITVGVLVGLGALWFLALQRISFRIRRARGNQTTTEPAMTEEEEAAEIVAFTRDLIDDLTDADDPRHAIESAYAAVETGFGTRELQRNPAETPAQYLHRALGRNGAVAEPLRRLTGLFETARYSTLDVDESMRGEAIAALSEIRDSYQRFVPSMRAR